MSATQPDTRDPRPVDNLPARYVVGRSGVVHKARCQCLPGMVGARRVMDIPAGPRCRFCWPTHEVVIGRNMTGWPRDYHPTPETPR